MQRPNFITMKLLRRSQINAISWSPGNEHFALKIALGMFFRLGLFFIAFYASNSIGCEIFMLASNLYHHCIICFNRLDYRKSCVLI